MASRNSKTKRDKLLTRPNGSVLSVSQVVCPAFQSSEYCLFLCESHVPMPFAFSFMSPLGRFGGDAGRDGELSLEKIVSTVSLIFALVLNYHFLVTASFRLVFPIGHHFSSEPF